MSSMSVTVWSCSCWVSLPYQGNLSGKKHMKVAIYLGIDVFKLGAKLPYNLFFLPFIPM